MGWNDKETVALIAGGHTLGRAHGACSFTNANMQGPYFESQEGSGRGPTKDGLCGEGKLAGFGPNTVSSGFEGPWTKTPSQWNYDYLQSTLFEQWEPALSVTAVTSGGLLTAQAPTMRPCGQQPTWRWLRMLNTARSQSLMTRIIRSSTKLLQLPGGKWCID